MNFWWGFDENERGQSLENKQLVVLAIEKVVDKKERQLLAEPMQKNLSHFLSKK
jgi:hypothetical protein